jgi:hypothetical protein
MDSAGTRVLTLVVADTPAGGRPDPEAVVTESPPAPDGEPSDRELPDALPPDAPLLDALPPDSRPRDTMPPDASELGDSESAGHTSTESSPLLPGTFVPGVRANGQTTEWGVPEFVLPDPPGPEVSAAEGAIAPSEPDASVAGTGSRASPVP